MEATSSTEGAPREDVVREEAPNGGEAPMDYQDASGDTSNAEGGTVATNENRERVQGEVEEVIGIVLPLGAGLSDGVPAIFTSSTNAADPAGTRCPGIQRAEDLDVLTRAPGNPLHDLTLGVEGRVSWVQGPDLIQRLQQVAIERLCQERDQLRRQLTEARAALPVAVAAERERIDGLEVCAAQLSARVRTANPRRRKAPETKRKMGSRHGGPGHPHSANTDLGT